MKRMLDINSIRSDGVNPPSNTLLTLRGVGSSYGREYAEYLPANGF